MKSIVLPIHPTTLSIIRSLKWGRMYKKDPLNGKFDILYHPTKIQNNINKLNKIGDCDDHAIYWCTNMLRGGVPKLCKKTWFSFYTMRKEDGSYASHAICVYTANSTFYFADYNIPIECKSIKQAFEISSKQRKASFICGYAIEVTSIDLDYTPKFGKGILIL